MVTKSSNVNRVAVFQLFLIVLVQADLFGALVSAGATNTKVVASRKELTKRVDESIGNNDDVSRVLSGGYNDENESGAKSDDKNSDGGWNKAGDKSDKIDNKGRRKHDKKCDERNCLGGRKTQVYSSIGWGMGGGMGSRSGFTNGDGNMYNRGYPGRYNGSKGNDKDNDGDNDDDDNDGDNDYDDDDNYSGKSNKDNDYGDYSNGGGGGGGGSNGRGGGGGGGWVGP